MKKWLIGCLVTGFLLVVLVCGAAYWFLWRPYASAGSDFISQTKDLAKIGQADQSVLNQSPYTAPVDGKLTPAQVAAFIAIQQTISDKMGPDFALMEEKYKKMSEQEAQPEGGDLKDVMGAYADITSLMAKAKEAQVVGLNAQNMSSEEYRWIREQVSAALPYLSMELPPLEAGKTPDAASTTSTGDTATDKTPASVDDAVAQAKKAAEDAVKQSMPGGKEMEDLMNGPDTEAGRANVELLRPHKELLYKTMSAAWMAM